MRPLCRKLSRNIPACFFVLTLLVNGTAVTAASEDERELNGFHAQLRVAYPAFSNNLGEVILNLKPAETEGEYHYDAITKARGLAKLVRSGTGKETTQFKLVDGQIVPLMYTVEGGSKSNDNDGEVRFDWDAGIAYSTYEGEAAELDIVPGILDRLSADLAVIKDLRDGKTPGSYDLITRNSIRTYAFEYLGEETLEVPAGTFDTVKYKRQRPGSRRSTLIWYAPELDYLPVRLEQQKEGKTSVTTVALDLQPAS